MHWYIRGILVLCMANLACSQEISQDNKDRINAGIAAGKEIADALKEENFRESITRIAKFGSKFLSAIGPMSSVLLAFIGTSDSDELVFMRSEFQKINSKLDVLSREFKNLRDHIDWSAVKVSYSEYEQQILVAEANLDKTYRASGQYRKQTVEHFLNEYSSHFGDSVDKLYNGIMLNQRFSDNIVRALVKKTKCYKKKVEIFTMGLTQLVLEGIKVKLSYFALKRLTYLCYLAQEEWKKKLQKMNDYFRKVSDECRDTYQSLMTNDVEDLLNKNNGKSNAKMAKNIYDFVKTKYDWRAWTVVVYDDVVGHDNHNILLCGGHAWLHRNGKNIIVSSQDKRDSARYDLARANKFLQDTEDLLKQCKIIAKTSENRARILGENMRDRSNSCFPFALKLVVTNDRPLSSISPNQLASRKIVLSKTCCFENDGWLSKTRCRYMLWKYTLVVAW